MSERYFYDKFWKSVDELHDQIQLEQWPASLNQNGKIQSADWTMKQFQNFFVGVYVKYIYLTRRIEDSYDQIIHVQIRATIKKFLENLLIRLVKIYGEICYYTNPILELKPMDYVFLDDYLFDLKLEPEAFEVVIPRYFREDNSEELINRRIILEEGLKRVNNGNALPEEDKTKFFFKIDIKIDDAMTILQNFEIVRQNIKRINVKLKLESKKAEEQIGGGQALDINEKRKLNLEHLIAIQKAKQIKENELKFLNMKPYTEKESAMIPALNSIGTNPTEKEEAFANIKGTTENRKDRKEIQKEKQKEYQDYNANMETQIKTIEGYDLTQKMINERRDWMEKYKHDNRGEPPQLLQLYYDQFKVTINKELDDNQKKEKDKIAKDKLKKEQDKKKKDEQGDKIKITPYTGPKGEEIANIQKYIGEFKNLFETASEFINQKDDFLVNISRHNALEKIKEAIKLEVDQMISIEIANRRTIFLKGKRDKIKKPPKVKAVPEKFCTGEKPLAKVPLFDLFNELIDKGIIRKMIPKNLEDLICDFNYIGFRMNINDQKSIEIPLFYTKQLVKKYCIFPLGSPFLKSNIHNVASVLFHGPPGTGKTHAALAIAHHCDALFFDLSPRNVEGKLNSKEEISRLLASTFRVAKNHQPAIIYFDNADQIFCNTKSKDATKNPSAQKMKRYIASMKNLITPNMRVLIIACSNKGWVIPAKDQKSMFDKSFYFGLPSYSDRLKLWKVKIQENTDQIDLLDFSVLAEMSKGFSHESIISCINYTLSKQRLERVKFNPIKADEFISALSKTEYVYQEVYENQKNFLFSISGLKEKHDFLEIKRQENEKNTKKR